MRPLLLSHAAQLVTLAGPARARRGAEMQELGLIPDGAVLIAGDRILRAGPTDTVARDLPAGTEERECRGQVVAPGLCDSHTHLVFAAPRLNDYERRLGGATYAEIAAAGGGIRSSVAAVRAADAGALDAAAAHWLRAAQRHGSTTVEIKTGYGLELEAERRSLAAAAAAARTTGCDAPRTFLGAHVVPAEFAHDRAEYVRQVTEVMLPAFADQIEFVDVFCETNAFTLAESRAVLGAAQQRGLGIKLHAEQFTHLGGVGLGIEMGAVSVDHLDAATEGDAALLARSPTVATLIPGANFFLGQPYPPARMLIAGGAAVALATDFNPGTCPIVSLPLVMSIACSQMRLTPPEAWTAATINGAAALGRAAGCGSLEAGKRADVAVFACDDYRAVPYYAGQNLCTAVVQAGIWKENECA